MVPQMDQAQLDAVEKLKNGCILCGEVGSGKSRTGLAYYFCKVCGGKLDGKQHGYKGDYVPMTDPKDLYIITTARKRDQLEWDNELVPFLISRDQKLSYYGDKINVVVDSWNNIRRYVDVEGAFFLFDEQKVVGSGPWSRAFIRIAKKNQWIFLSATPGDVWTDYLSIFIANGFYRNRREFADRHVIYSRYSKYPRIDRYLEEEHLKMLRDKILVNIDYTKPTERHSEEISVSYDRDAYRKLMLDRWNYQENRPIDNASELCFLLRRIVNSDPSRSEAVLDVQWLHDKLIIFYKFDYELEILKSLKYREGTVIAEWNGHRHEPIPDSEMWVYLVQYFSGAEGWNCTQTDTVLFYSLDYSYKTMEQAMGRIDRRNTPFHDLYYYTLKSRAPIDIAITRALRQKRNFNESRFLSKYVLKSQNLQPA